MIIPDINLLIYAYSSDAPHHSRAKCWWEDCLSGSQSVGLPWVVLLGFLRLLTSRSVLLEPWPPNEVTATIRTWVERPQVVIVQPGPSHLDLLRELLDAARGGGQLTTDAHLAAMAIEHQAELHSNDSDFDRFPGLRWVNPLRES